MKTLLLACSDLFFASKVETTAKALGCVTVRVSSIEDLGVGEAPSLFVVDLDGVGPEPSSLIATAREMNPKLPIFAFARHDQAEKFREAREAGATKVFSRGAFSQKLPDLVAASTGATMEE